MHGKAYKERAALVLATGGDGVELIDAADPANGWAAIHYAVAYDQVEVRCSSSLHSILKGVFVLIIIHRFYSQGRVCFDHHSSILFSRACLF